MRFLPMVLLLITSLLSHEIVPDDIEILERDSVPELFLRAAIGDFEYVRSKIEKENIPVDTTFREPLFFYACYGGHPEIAEYLLANGADPNGHFFPDVLPIDVASQGGFPEIVTLLMDRVEYPRSTIHRAAVLSGSSGNLEMIKYWLDYGIDINYRGNQTTFLTRAAGHQGERNDLKIVRYLVEQGADVNLASEKKRTPLLSAVMGGNIGIIRYLVSQGASLPDTVSNSYDSPLVYVGWKNYDEVTRYLVTELRVNPNARGGRWVGHTPLMYSILDGSEETMQTLLDHGADPDFKNLNEEYPPLKLAGDRKVLWAVRTLLENGADPAATDRHGSPALSYCFRSAGRYKDTTAAALVEYIMENYVPLRDSSWSALGRRIHGGFTLADSTLFYCIGRSEHEIFLRAVAYLSSINAQDEAGNTLLSYAIHREENITYLLDHGADTAIVNHHGKTVMDMVRENRFTSDDRYMANYFEQKKRRSTVSKPAWETLWKP